MKDTKEKKTGKISISAPRRVTFPSDETGKQWLPMLLDAYFIADQGVYEGIKKRLNQGQHLACAKGCSSCCKTHTTIPVYPLELTGLYWYVIDKVHDERREKLKNQLKNFTLGNACPFLTDGICGIHQMRPMACRFFNVFGTSCEESEDPFYTRRQDVLTPIKKFKEKALYTMLPFHGITLRAKKKEFIKKGLIHSQVQNLHEIDWPKLADRMGG